MASDPHMPQIDAALGKVAVAAGSAGLTLQLLTDWGGLLVIGLNILLALGGLYLLWLRALKLHRDLGRDLRGDLRGRPDDEC